MPLDPCLAEELVSALIVALLRSGVISDDDLLAAEGLSEDARALIEALIVEAEAPATAEWKAQKARGRFSVVED